jgi:hypothetical protein
MCKNYHSISKNIIFVYLLIASTSSLFADHRNFVWTYEYMIMDKGLAEFESYQTFSTKDLDDMSNTTTTELNMEFEIGMNDFWDAAIYQNFKQVPGGSLKYSGFKIRNRFKIGETGKYFLDPLIYIEYIGDGSFSKHEIEPKLILAKTMGKFSFSLNPYCEIEKVEDEWEFTPKYAMGATYNLFNYFNVGFEFKGDKEVHYFGPTISHGSKSFWFALGTLFNLNEIKPGYSKLQTRMIMGFEL